VKSNQLEWNWQWQHLPMCKHHQLIAQCQLNNVKIVGQGAEWHDLFIFMKYEIHISCNGCKSISHNIMQSHPFPTMNAMKKWISIRSKVGFKCSVTPQGLNDGKDLT